MGNRSDAGLFLNYGFTRPQVFSQGPIAQEQDGGNFYGSEAVPGLEDGTIIDGGTSAAQVPTIAPPTDGSMPLVVPPSEIPPGIVPSPRGPSPAPTPAPAGPRAFPMGRSEGRSASFEANEYEPAKLRDAGRTFNPMAGGLQQEPATNENSFQLMESAAADESRQGRTSAGTHRPAAGGPRF